MIMCDMHVHTTFCDGKNSPEEMVLSAINKGLKAVGVVTHSHTAFDQSYCIKKQDIKVFQDQIAFLREKYKDKIKVFCGVEQDYYGTESTEGFDYVIGSLHYFKVGEKFMHVDNTIEDYKRAVEELFDGDYYSAVEHYYGVLSNVVEKTGADIIGHFDLIAKFNKANALFDENNPRYVEASMQTLEKLIRTKKVFEINTGAISRGYMDRPYPASHMIELIKARGGKLILSSDSHAAKNVAYMFDEYKDLQNY